MVAKKSFASAAAFVVLFLALSTPVLGLNNVVTQWNIRYQSAIRSLSIANQASARYFAELHLAQVRNCPCSVYLTQLFYSDCTDTLLLNPPSVPDQDLCLCFRVLYLKKTGKYPQVMSTWNTNGRY